VGRQKPQCTQGSAAPAGSPGSVLLTGSVLPGWVMSRVWGGWHTEDRI